MFNDLTFGGGLESFFLRLLSNISYNKEKQERLHDQSNHHLNGSRAYL